MKKPIQDQEVAEPLAVRLVELPLQRVEEPEMLRVGTATGVTLTVLVALAQPGMVAVQV